MVVEWGRRGERSGLTRSLRTAVVKSSHHISHEIYTLHEEGYVLKLS